MKRHVPTSSLPMRLAADRSSAFATALKSKLLWQAELLKETFEEENASELQRRNQWQCEALLAAADVVAHLHRALAQRGAADRTRRQAGDPLGAPEPTLTLLIEIGWMAWEAGHESHALRILGGVGGAADGAMGCAMFQASAYMNEDRTADAANVLDDAIARWGDRKGEVSSTLAMLWLSLGNPKWRALARQVTLHATSASAREMCADALNSSGKCPMGHLN